MKFCFYISYKCARYAHKGKGRHSYGCLNIPKTAKQSLLLGKKKRCSEHNLATATVASAQPSIEAIKKPLSYEVACLLVLFVYLRGLFFRVNFSITIFLTSTLLKPDFSTSSRNFETSLFISVC